VLDSCGKSERPLKKWLSSCSRSLMTLSLERVTGEPPRLAPCGVSLWSKPAGVSVSLNCLYRAFLVTLCKYLQFFSGFKSESRESPRKASTWSGNQQPRSTEPLIKGIIDLTINLSILVKVTKTKKLTKR
jgi:hypothetical protein